MASEANSPLIAIVDDDPLFRETLAGNLGDAGYGVRAWGDGEAFLADLAAQTEPDLLLLDWKMPGINGIEVLRRLRSAQVALPVIFLTVLSDQIFEEAALLGGAVDFIEKSRSFTILERRIALTLGRAAAAEPAAATRVGGLSLDTTSRRAQWRGRPVDLTVGEFSMVEALAAKAGRDVSYRELYDSGRGKGFHGGAGEDGYRTNVRAAIKRIREKFKTVDPDFEQIGNYPGFGYVWQAERDA
ncbi:response regulator transcription factor [Paramagnetospirillum magneticum]|uniref:Response regulator consisting of a CheY-like receiver domain and a winged-helix DNA-binding domain n=1 Tax=Paramagnetospirillum magneticum (strain ATCC 700264 / AMB-1) TaxID=342108 RepID=Q2VZ70_PARM1|nr:response regulator transcription factor [Paramagnetospirillum magneticum]BAE53105.1 Response regulator consisting of a CheY-like receiver domain and a winged-helix DNA-binding domain [Paramagnetospirillum magneticum AMB-1]